MKKNIFLFCVLLAVIGLGGVYQISLLFSKPLPGGVRADKVLVEKAKRRLTLLKEGRVLKSYRIALGGNPIGHKQQEGDERTPEGIYYIEWHHPGSAFYRAIKISYPNSEDQARAAKRGVSPGGFIMIHGLPRRWAWIGPLHTLWDWTDGCIAVTNREMAEIYRAVPDGTPVIIVP